MKNNSVHLIGTLTRDIVLSKNSKGNSFVRFTLACTRDNKPFTDFINCIAFGEVANAQKFEDGFYRQHMENYEEPKLTSKKLDVDAVLEKIKQDPEPLSQLIDILSKD